MASTATNKQPLLIDRVLHEIIDLAGASVAENSGIAIGGTNTAQLIIDGTTQDGCLIEDVYSISRGVAYVINLYLSNASDYLRPQQGIFIGTFNSGSTSVGQRTEWGGMPKIIAPMPQTGTTTHFQALYIPKGKALWAAVELQTGNPTASDAPLIGVQGGFY